MGRNAPGAGSEGSADFLFAKGGLSKTKGLGTAVPKQAVCSLRKTQCNKLLRAHLVYLKSEQLLRANLLLYRSRKPTRLLPEPSGGRRGAKWVFIGSFFARFTPQTTEKSPASIRPS